jgi:hypothetical protein
MQRNPASVNAAIWYCHMDDGSAQLAAKTTAGPSSQSRKNKDVSFAAFT